MAYPKLTLRVKLLKNNSVKFELIKVHDLYLNSGNSLITGENVYTDNDWLIYLGSRFYINPTNKYFIIPEKPNKDNDIICFSNDKDRKFFLKDFYDALLYWSDISYFKNKSFFDKTANIKFNDDIWLIF